MHIRATPGGADCLQPKRGRQQSDLISSKNRRGTVTKAKWWELAANGDPIPRLAFQLGANPENCQTVAVRGAKMVQQQQFVSINKLFNCALQQQRSPFDACLALFLLWLGGTRSLTMFWAPLDGQMPAHAIVQPPGGADHF
jgi:hypothetical protein